MEQNRLDRLLDASAPRIDDAADADALVLRMVDEAVSTQPRTRRSRVAIAAFAIGGTLALGTGAAIAAPFIADWWMWIPRDDLALETAPFEHDGELITCKTTLRVTIDGGSATDDSAARLQKARDYLRSVDPDDFQDDAKELRSQSDDVTWSHLSPEADQNGYVALAVSFEMHELGLTGEGVGLDIQARCQGAE